VGGGRVVGWWDRRGGRHGRRWRCWGGGDVGGGGGSIDRRCCACIYRARVHNVTEREREREKEERREPGTECVHNLQQCAYNTPPPCPHHSWRRPRDG